ncbi:MAG: penicillin-binding transpeptidase domain-containing protein, partial [Paracoccaceae bacterium]
VIQASTAYQVTSMLEGAVQRGTGIKLKPLGIPLAGKTGTTNESRDAWFMGFTPNLVVGVYVGHDEPKPLGRKETGSSIAVPIFKSFMERALKNVPATPFRIPPGLSLVRVDARTGLPAPAGQRGAILEAFKPGTEPTADRLVLDDAFVAYKGSNISGTGGLY